MSQFFSNSGAISLALNFYAGKGPITINSRNTGLSGLARSLP